MKTYYPVMRITGKISPTVEIDETKYKNIIRVIKKKMDEIFDEADFGPLSDIDGELIFIEDEDGNRIYERR